MTVPFSKEENFMNAILKRALAMAALLCLTFALAGCQNGAGKALEQAGTALKNKDSGAFVAQFDMQAYAAHEFANLKQSNQLLSGLDSMGKMLGLGSQVNDLIKSIMDLQGRYTDTFTRTVATGELQEQCSRAKTPDCPWVPEALANAEVRELSETAAVAKVTTPANMTSWIALRKHNDQWKIVGKAVLQDTAEKFANDAAPMPQENKDTKLNIPEKTDGGSGAAKI